ncbi:MAG: NPCBM/NEW2 domain-containing protein [Lentisphaeraceae bacterium]|nr:NPCBM/NEW2 domain-containing protein [Lentisphaeraceae bacterium]
MKFYNRELIEYFLDNTADEDQLSEILELVKNDEDFRKELAEASRMKGLLVSVNQENEDGVFRGVSRSISEMEPDSIELKILDSLSEVSPEQKVIYKDKKSWLLYFWAGIAAQVLVVFTFFSSSETEGLYHGSLYSESGQAWLVRGELRVPVTADLRLMDGDKVLVEDKGDLRITWNDSTVTQFKDETEAVFSLKNGKKINLKFGKFQAQVTKQAPGSPMVISTPSSTITVLGTRFRLNVSDSQSLLEVDRGAVEMANNKGDSLVVKAHQYAVASKKAKFESRVFNRPVYQSPEVNLDTPSLEVDIVAEINGSNKIYLVVSDSQDGRSHDHAAWLNPVLEDALGRQYSLLDLPWKFASSEWGTMGIGIDALGKPLTHNGTIIKDGIGTHALSIIEYDIPAGYKLFKAKGVVTDSGSVQSNSRSSIKFEIYTEFPENSYRRLKVNRKSDK